jgi:quercetin dioxygenase-like cupin family protein
MPADLSKQISAAALGNGVIRDLAPYRSFSREDANVVVMYEDVDQTLVVWNLEPGQENARHLHPANAHTMLVLEGEGRLLRADGAEAPIKAGDWIVIPRATVHGIRNTGTTRMSYLAVTTNGAEGYVKQDTTGAVVGQH